VGLTVTQDVSVSLYNSSSSFANDANRGVVAVDFTASGPVAR
jgi:hypothetical protein